MARVVGLPRAAPAEVGSLRRRKGPENAQNQGDSLHLETPTKRWMCTFVWPPNGLELFPPGQPRLVSRKGQHLTGRIAFSALLGALERLERYLIEAEKGAEGGGYVL